jgi:hypothetical protein
MVKNFSATLDCFNTKKIVLLPLKPKKVQLSGKNYYGPVFEGLKTRWPTI